MKKDLNWLKRLNNEYKGIWGIQYPIGSFFNVESICNLPHHNCETEIFYITKISGALKLKDNSNALIEPNLSEIFQRALKASEKNEYQSIRIIIANFHNADITEQCNLIKSARGVQESSELSCQFIFCGQWNYYDFSSNYYKIYGRTNSPPAHSRDILHLPSWHGDDVLDLLYKERLIASSPSEIDRIASDFIVEQTAGDEFLIYEAITYLKSHKGEWTSNIEQVLCELASAQEILAEINKRINSLDEESKAELLKILQFHYLIRDYENIISEKLWIAGLIQRHKLEGGKQLIQVAGSLINIIMRQILAEENPNISPPEYLCFDRKAISIEAYRRIARIENMLRNLIVSEYYSKNGTDLYDNLKAITLNSYISEDQENLIKLVLFHVRSELRINFENEITKTNDERLSFTNPSKTDLLKDAQNWQKRQRENHAVELSQDNIMHFLTTESLGKVLNYKKSGFHGDKKNVQKRTSNDDHGRIHNYSLCCCSQSTNQT